MKTKEWVGFHRKYSTSLLTVSLLKCWRLPSWNQVSGLGFPVGKEPAYNAGDLGSIPGSGRSPGGGHGNLPHYSCLENPHGQRILAGYSSWGHKELDMTERLSTAEHIHGTARLVAGVES